MKSTIEKCLHITNHDMDKNYLNLYKLEAMYEQG